MQRARKNRGSVVLMVVGLLTIIAMLGSTFVIVAKFDRRQSKALVATAPLDDMAESMLAMIVQELLDDLRIDTGGVYTKATAGDPLSLSHLIDFAHDDVDSLVATTDIMETGAHKSKVGGMTLGAEVDADGDGVNDAYLFDTGVTTSTGEKMFVAVRVIDGGSCLNVNIAYAPLTVNDEPMLHSNVSLVQLAGQAVADNIHKERSGATGPLDDAVIRAYNTQYVLCPDNASAACRPYDMSDMLALHGRGNHTGPTATGRLFTTLGAACFNASRRHMTTWSTSRVMLPVPVAAVAGKTDITPLTHRVDLNKADYADLFRAFYNAIPADASIITGTGAGEQDNSRRLLAAQLAVNVIDFRDADSEVTVQTPKNSGGADIGTVYGIERQPFVTEAFGKKYKDATDSMNIVTREYWAVELFNPYTTQIDLTDYKITSAGGDADLTGVIDPGKRVVLVSDALAITVNAAGTEKEISSLDLSGESKILRRPTGAATKTIMIAKIPPVDPGEPADNEKTIKNIIWHDVRSDALYTRDIKNVLTTTTGHDYTNVAAEGGTSTDATSRLGQSNTDLPPDQGLISTPVYVRNGEMISMGDLCRIFYYGPSDTKSLREQLGTTAGRDVGRLDPAGTAGTYADDLTPDVPIGALLTDYLTLASPLEDGVGADDDEDDVVYGRVNINTAPKTVLMCLGLTDAQASAIITQRTSKKGFSTTGEVAAVIGTTANNTYSVRSPDNYAIAVGPANSKDDDGLPTADTEKVDGDLIKYHAAYSWISNHITVRSDTYIAYIRVQIGATNPRQVRYYAAVIDRSNCREDADRPVVRMFGQTK